MRKTVARLVTCGAFAVTGVVATADVASAAAPCTLHYSLNWVNGRTTVYSTPYRATGNKFRVVRDGRIANYTLRNGSGISVPTNGITTLYAWRKVGSTYKPCAGSPKNVGRLEHP